MNELTREECLKALDDSNFLSVVVIDQDGDIDYKGEFKETVVFDLFGKLIQEHFDNPPLKLRAIEQIKNQWIPVEERLPENEKDIGRNYLVTLKYSNLNSIIATCARFEPSGRWLRYCAIGEVDVTDEVIAWMPLPEAYGGRG